MKWKLKLHNTSIKSIFRIAKLIYFRDIWKIHLLCSEKISFLMAICRKCLEHFLVFPVDLFWSNLRIMFPPIPFSWNSQVWNFSHPYWELKHFFFGKFQSFLHSVNERQVIIHKKMEKYDGKNVWKMQKQPFPVRRRE